MKKRVINMCMAVLVGVTVLTGCSKKFEGEEKIMPITTEDTTKKDEQEETTGNKTEASNPERKDSYTDAGEMIDLADIRGDVVSFDETGCIISRQVDEGNLAYSAAEGVVDESLTANIIFGDNIKFQLAHINYTSGALESLEDAGQEILLKQSFILVYGTYEDDNTIRAEKIIIVRGEH